METISISVFDKNANLVKEALRVSISRSGGSFEFSDFPVMAGDTFTAKSSDGRSGTMMITKHVGEIVSFVFSGGFAHRDEPKEGVQS